MFFFISQRQKYLSRKERDPIRMIHDIYQVWPLILPVKASSPSHHLLRSWALPLHQLQVHSTSQCCRHPSFQDRKTSCRARSGWLKQHFTFSLGTGKQVREKQANECVLTSEGGPVQETGHSRKCTIIGVRKARQSFKSKMYIFSVRCLYFNCWFVI